MKTKTEIQSMLKEFASRITGREYRDELTKDDIAFAKDNRIVIVYGQSDDIMTFAGAITDEIDCYGGGHAYIGKHGLLIANQCDDEYCPYFKKETEKAISIEAIWDDEPYDFTWKYVTTIPHETFEIFEKQDDDRDNDKYCQGIVFCTDLLEF